MNSINIIGKMLKAVDEKGEIKSKLDDIRRNKKSFDINLNRLTDLIDKDKLDKEDLKKENEKYKIIAKLSFDLYIDYEYYRDFSIKNKSKFEDYSEELTNLGYELRDNDEWVNVKRPNIDGIIDNIFMSHLCQSILSQCESCDSGTREDHSRKPIFGAPVWRSKNNKLDKFWCCEKCKIVNDIDKVCSKCGFGLNDFSKTMKIQYKYKLTRKRKHSADYYYEVESTDDERPSWKCERCEITNRIFNGCCNCDFRRSFKWKLPKTNRESEMSVEFEGRNREMEDDDVTENCEMCDQKEAVIEGVCIDCLSDPMFNWKCPLVFCKHKNSGKDFCCLKCKICRHANLEHGSPNWMYNNNQFERVWVCNDCGGINKWEEMVCQDNNPTWYQSKKCTSERDKFRKWCIECSFNFEKTESRCNICSKEF